MTTATEETVEAKEDLLLHAAIDTAKLPAVSILAYSGGIMKVAPWGDIVIDLAGLDVTGSVAILSDHDSSRGGIVGHGRAHVEQGRLVVAGTISAKGEAADEIVAAAKGGFPWQASVGVEVLDHRKVAAGETIQINNRTIKATSGFTLVTKGRLREVSIVSLGCDAATTVAIAASKESKNMEAVAQEQVRDTQETVETQRVEAIRRLCGSKHADIEAMAMKEGWDVMRTELEILRASRPKVPFTGMVDRPGGPVVLEAAILSHMGKSRLGEKALGAMVMEQASAVGGGSMIDLCRAALYMDGQDVPRGRMEMVKAALSTYSLPTALGNVANKVLLDAYSDTPASWQSFCAVRSVADFKQNTGVKPSFLGGLERVAPGGELKHGTVGEWTMQYAIDTFGKLLSVDRRDIINDDLGVFNDSAAALGRPRCVGSLTWCSTCCWPTRAGSSARATATTSTARTAPCAWTRWRRRSR